MSLVSLWIKKTPWLWGPFLIVTLFTAYLAGVITPIALLPIGLLLFLHFLMIYSIQRWGRLLLFTLITTLSVGLLFHLFPGFQNPSFSTSYGKLWINFDKPFIGLFPLALSIPLIASKAQWRTLLQKTLPLILLGIIALLTVVLSLGLVQWDPKLPAIFPLWAINNLVFVCVAEEAFFRGFLQKEFTRWLGTGLGAQVGAVFAASLVFTLAHVLWVPSIPFLFAVFVASAIYGTVYAATQSIEASILCHFLINLLHFILFTYGGAHG